MKKRKMLALLLTLCLLVSLASACGSQSAESTETGAAEASETQEETAQTDSAETEASASAEPEAEESETAEAASEEAQEEAVEEAEAEETPAESAEAEEESAQETAEEKEIVHLIDFPIEEPFTITVSMSTTPSLTGSALIGDDGSSLGWAQWLSERTGADIEVDLYSFLNSTDKQNLMIASGDYTDVIVGSLSYSGGVDGAVEDGVLANIAEYAEYMPDYLNILYQNVDNVALAYSTDFNLTAFYGINDSEAKAEYGPVIRQDWLDELGLETPVTYDDLHDVLTAFKENYGATLWVTSYGGVPGDLSGGYGVMEYSGGAGFPTWTENGEFKFAATEDAFKDYLTMMHQWYEEGLIYPDFISQGGSDYPENSLFTTGEVGVWFTYASYLEAEQTLLEDGEIAGFAWPVLEAGQETNPATYGKAANNVGIDGQGGFSITTASEDLALLCAVFNEFYTEEGLEFCNWGIENETYTLNEDGTHSFTDLITNDEYNLGANIMMTYYFFKDGPFLYDYDRYLASYSDMQMAACEAWTTGGVNPTASTMTTEQSSEYYTAQVDISTVYQEYTVKFITGDKDIEADWQEFLDQLNGCGLERFMELGQLGIDQYSDRMADVEALVDAYYNE